MFTLLCLAIMSVVMSNVDINCSIEKCFIVSGSALIVNRNNLVCRNEFYNFTVNYCEDADVHQLYYKKYDVRRNETDEVFLMVEVGRILSCFFVFGLVISGVFLAFCCSYCCRVLWLSLSVRFQRRRYQPIF